MSCPWPVDRTCLPELPALSDPPTQDEQDAYDAAVAARNDAENKAVSVLWALSGRQFSCEERIVRPEPVAGGGICDEGPLIEAYYRNDWRGVPLAGPSPRSVRLAGPVQSIVTVTIEDTVLDESEYVLEGDLLYRRNGKWPRNDMSRPRGEVGTWSVTYIQGTPPPAFVGGFVGELASEMMMACADQKRCRLPRTVVSTSRSGVSHVFDPTRMLAAGFTGLSGVDTWLASVNPNKLAHTARIL